MNLFKKVFFNFTLIYICLCIFSFSAHAEKYTTKHSDSLNDGHVIKIIAGYNKSIAIKDDGSMWLLGGNNWTAQFIDYMNYSELDDLVIANASSGVYPSFFALKKDGTVWVWGRNNSGQLGLGDKIDRDFPTQITSLGNNVVKISSNGNSTAFIKSDGSLWVCGNNSDGILGLGNTTAQLTPVKVNITNVADVSMAGQHTLVLKEDGTVWASGRNNLGQLGLGNTASKYNLTQITSLGSDITEIHTGSSHSFVKKENGDYYGWGNNDYGQLGIDDSSSSKLSPVKNNTISGREGKLIIKNDTSIFIEQNGNVLACGNNYSYQINPSIPSSKTFIKADNFSGNEKEIFVGVECIYILE